MADRAGALTVARTRREALPFLAAMFAVFSMASGSSVVVPLLPFVFQGDSSDSTFSQSLHVGLFTGLYLLASFLFAPFWGRWSDRVGRRSVLLITLAGQAVCAGLLGLRLELSAMYLVRALAGGFAAGTLPVVQAWIADHSQGSRRGRRFGWVAAVSLFGFLVGPLIGGMFSTVRPPFGDAFLSPLLAAPSVAAASIAAIGFLAVYMTMPETATGSPPGSDAKVNDAPVKRGAGIYLVLAVVLLFGIGAFEVAVSLFAKASLAFGPREIGLMFMECSLFMIAAQVMAFSRVAQGLPHGVLTLGGLLLMAGAISAIPLAGRGTSLVALIGVFAFSSGLLIPLLSFWTSSSSPVPQGKLMGRLSAVSNLGQAVGAISAGPLFGIQPLLGFWLPALVLAAGAALAARAGTLRGQSLESYQRSRSQAGSNQ